MAQEFNISGTLSLDDQMSKVLDNASNSVSSFGSKTGSSLDRISGVTKKIGNVTMATGAAVTAVGVKSLKSYGTFQSSLNKAAVVAGGTKKDIGGLADMANRMGAELPLSAQDSADAMIQMASAGASVGKIKKNFPAIAEAATATGEDLQDTASVVQNSMNIWGDSLKSPARAAAILTKTANLSNAGISDMNQAIATIGGTASNAGFGMGDMTEAIGLMTNRGFSAAQASQDLNHAILQMQAPSKGAAKQMKELGLTFTDKSGNMKKFPTILREISKSMDGMTGSEKTAALKKMFGTSGMAAILPLLDSIKNKSGDTSKSWDAFHKSMNAASKDSATATKYLKDQANEMQQNVGSKIEQVGGNWEALSNKSMASKSKITGGMLDMINSGLEWASKSDSSIAQVARGFIGLSPIVGPAMTAVGAGIRNVVPMFKMFGSVGSSVVKAGSSLVGFGAKMLGLGKSSKVASTATKEVANGATKSGSAAGSSAGQILAMGTAFLEAAAGVALVIGSFTLLIGAITQLATTGTAGVVAIAAITVAIAALAGVFALLGPRLTSSVAGIVGFGASIAMIGVGIGAATAGIGLLVMGFAQLNMSFVALTSVSGQLIPMFANLGMGMSIMMTSFLTSVISNIPLIIQAFVTLGSGVLSAINTLMPQLVSTGMNMIMSILNGINSNISKIISVSVDIMTKFIGGLAKGLPQILAKGTEFIVNLFNGIAQSLPKIIAAATNVITAFITGIGNNLGKIADAGIKLISKFADTIIAKQSKMAAAATKLIQAFVTSVGTAMGVLLSSGNKLVGWFIQGVLKGLGKSRSAGKSNADAVKNGAKADLGANGRAIMNSFLSGLKSTWGAVQGFVSGIGTWIKDHKGPISYDKKLLIPAGKAIMNGFNGGLVNGFGNVQSNISGMTDSIAKQFDFNINPNAIADNMNMVNRQLQTGLNASLDSNISLSQPAQINLNLGGKNYHAFVGDITNQQNVDLTIDKQYSL